MSNGVEFEADNFGGNRSPGFQPNGGGGDVSKFGRWLLDKGIVKTEKGAQNFQLGLVVVNFIIMFIVIKSFL